jgi:hypothetical protein
MKPVSEGDRGADGSWGPEIFKRWQRGTFLVLVAGAFRRGRGVKP